MESANLSRPAAHPHPTFESVVWLLHLRWVAVAGQLCVIAGVQWLLRIDLPIMSLLALVSFTAATNAIYSFWLDLIRRRTKNHEDHTPTYHLVACLMLVDLLTLTGMLWLSGSLQNPFALFYFVNIAVAGVILTPVWAWSLWAGAVVCVLMLTLIGEPLPALQNSGWLSARSRWTIGSVGLLISFATCGGVITYFITMLTGELKRRELELQAAEDERLRARQLEGLATLAAGAGHELATPLSTIAVVVKELARSVEKYSLPASVGQDVALIRSELDHCRQILDRLASAAGDAAGERLTQITVEQFFHEVLLGVREPQRVQAQVTEQVKPYVSVLPVQAAAQAVRNLVQNAIDASQPGADVQLGADLSGDMWKIYVIDRGDGMTSEVLQRIGQPFFTTKEPGRGMGLGLYLTQNVLNRLGGKLVFTSKPGHGTTAEVTLPCKRV